MYVKLRSCSAQQYSGSIARVRRGNRRRISRSSDGVLIRYISNCGQSPISDSPIIAFIRDRLQTPCLTCPPQNECGHPEEAGRICLLGTRSFNSSLTCPKESGFRFRGIEESFVRRVHSSPHTTRAFATSVRKSPSLEKTADTPHERAVFSMSTL